MENWFIIKNFIWNKAWNENIKKNWNKQTLCKKQQNFDN